MEILESFDSKEENTRSFVSYCDDKQYHVSMKDMDADEFLPVVLIFANKEEAVEKAKQLVGLSPAPLPSYTL